MASVTNKSLLEKLEAHAAEDLKFQASINGTAWKVVGAIAIIMLTGVVALGSGIGIQAWAISHSTAHATEQAATVVSAEVAKDRKARRDRDQRIEALLSQIASEK